MAGKFWVPLAVYLALFLIVILSQSIDEALLITGGLFAVIVGLMFFMEGLRIGLMPFGTIIGHSLPQPATAFTVATGLTDYIPVGNRGHICGTGYWCLAGRRGK